MKPSDDNETRASRPDGWPGETKPMGEVRVATKLLLGRYRILAELGKGGMGTAHRCHDTVTKTDVAVKTLRPDLAAQREHLEAVRANFAIVERLHHPHIAALKTLERDPADGSYLLVMEYVEGVSLARTLEEHGGAMAAQRALPLLRQLASALDYGHREKIIHRDIKPANVLVDLRGRAKLLDYGIAARCDDLGDSEEQAANTITGTAAYMAPEQWRAQSQDARTDQYAFAVLCCKVLTGKLPFSGPKVADFKLAALTKEPDLPDALGAPALAVLRRGLARNREDRFESCGELVEALSQAFARGPVVGRRPPWRLAAALAVAATLAVVIGLAVRGRSAAPGQAASLPVPNVPAIRGGDVALPRYSALVIGVGDYSSHGADGWDDLTTARGDAVAVGETLAKDYGFRVRMLLDDQASRQGIMDALDEIATSASNEAILVYYAGHGYYEQSLGEGYWIPQDARQTRGGKPAHHEWIWNSTITKIVGASAARHVLIVADACFAGSLFRGGEIPSGNRQMQWYRRALDVPSRYLITSGDLEPVLDSGARHSIFCQQLLNFLTHGDRKVFSASDLGAALKERVSSMTGQLVRMGQLPVASHAGGEFVFVRDAAPLAGLPVAPQPVDAGGPPALERKRQWSADASDAVALASQGATGAAQRVLARVQTATGDKALVEVLNRFVAGDANRKADDQLQQLIDRVGARAGKVGALDPRHARPRVLACIGPEAQDGSPENQSLALLYRILLRSELEAVGGLQVVERTALEKALTEQDLSTSSLADKNAQVEVGRLLPASLLLVGEVFHGESGDRLFLRLVDTASTRVLGSFMAEVSDDAKMKEACDRLAVEIAAKAARAKPLRALVLEQAGNRLSAAVGSFQGAAPGQTYDVLIVNPAASAILDRERTVGTAVVRAVEEMQAEFDATWKSDPVVPAAPAALWVREVVTPQS